MHSSIYASSLGQFMEGPTFLVMNHIYNRQMSYKTGVMTCRSSIDGIPLGEKLTTLSTEHFEQIKDNNTDNLDATQNVSKKQYQRHAKLWATLNKQQKMLDNAVLQMLDYFGLNSLFLSTTPDNKCSFRLRLYCKPQYWVRSIYSKME
jgi:hypothetical protein